MNIFSLPLSFSIILVIFAGLLFGSFASVLITRLENEKITRKVVKSILRGRSYCPWCKKKLTAKNLVPLLSFLVQKGKCSNCKKKIPFFYPLLELITAGVFVFTYFYFPYSSLWGLLFFLLINRILLMLLIYDLKYYELNDVFFCSLLGILAISIVFSLFSGEYFSSVFPLLYWFFFWLIFLGIYFFARRYVKMRNIWREGEWIWFGDVLLALPIGVLLGTRILEIFGNNDLFLLITMGVQLFLIHIILSGCLGVIYYLIYYLVMKLVKKDQDAFIPFFPAMIIALWVIIMFPNSVLLFVQYITSLIQHIIYLFVSYIMASPLF